jgi:hypothetical protein
MVSGATGKRPQCDEAEYLRMLIAASDVSIADMQQYPKLFRP